MEPTREYKAIVWKKTDPDGTGQRVSVHARDAAEARRLIVEQFGEDITCSIWNEEDANKTR